MLIVLIIIKELSWHPFPSLPPHTTHPIRHFVVTIITRSPNFSPPLFARIIIPWNDTSSRVPACRMRVRARIICSQVRARPIAIEDLLAVRAARAQEPVNFARGRNYTPVMISHVYIYICAHLSTAAHRIYLYV